MFQHSVLLTSGLLQSFVLPTWTSKALKFKIPGLSIAMFERPVCLIYFKIPLLSSPWHTHEFTNVCSMNKWMKCSVGGRATATSDCEDRPGGWECSRSKWGAQSSGAQCFLKAVWVGVGCGTRLNSCLLNNCIIFPSKAPQEKRCVPTRRYVQITSYR